MFIKCDEIHYRFAEMIEKSLNVVFLCEMVGCTVIICFLEFGVLKVFPLKISSANINYSMFLQKRFMLIQNYFRNGKKERS